MSIIKQIKAKNKAKEVIKTCVNLKQCSAAKQYIVLYNKKFHDLVGFTELKVLLEKHEITLSI